MKLSPAQSLAGIFAFGQQGVTLSEIPGVVEEGGFFKELQLLAAPDDELRY